MVFYLALIADEDIRYRGRRKQTKDWRNQMKKMMNKFMANTDGATLIEYGLIAALIAVVLVAGLQGLQGGLTNTFQDVTNQL